MSSGSGCTCNCASVPTSPMRGYTTPPASPIRQQHQLRRPVSASPTSIPRPPLREPEQFAREMAEMRKRYEGKHLSPQQRDRLTIEAYDGFLGELRRQEQMLLLKRRQLEMEKVRGPLPSWWEMKDARFTDEMRRHRAMMEGRLDRNFADQLVRSSLP